MVIFYRMIEDEQAKIIVNEIKNTVKNNWRNLAKKYGLGRSEIERMKPALRISEC
ncbi:MAG: hypothetical protein PUF12_10500 [Thermoflexaceae bacterium]|nr:hypothetical protein [Thermoflexaceae bacterium]